MYITIWPQTSPAAGKDEECDDDDMTDLRWCGLAYIFDALHSCAGRKCMK